MMTLDDMPDSESVVILRAGGDGLQIVGALRSYRAVSLRLLRNRYRDGEVDGATLSEFKDAVAEIETLLRDEDFDYDADLLGHSPSGYTPPVS